MPRKDTKTKPSSTGFEKTAKAAAKDDLFENGFDLEGEPAEDNTDTGTDPSDDSK
jgi:hypothetical protein